jgi:hypothetical protein
MPPWAFEFADRGDIAEENLQDVFFLGRQIGVEKVEVFDDDLQRFGEMAELLAVAADVRRCGAFDGQIGGVAQIDAEETESPARQDRFAFVFKGRTMARRRLRRTLLA